MKHPNDGAAPYHAPTGSEDLPDPVQMAIYAGWTPSQRWECAVRLRATAWELKAAFCRAEHPDWTDQQVEAEVRRGFLHAGS